MQGMGILFRAADPFWKLTPPAGVKENPMGYYCAPNAATPDYVASYNIRDFLAYGFLCCYDCVTPDNFTMWNMVQADDVKWLRENFLRVVEKLILNIYGGAVEIPTLENDFDPGQWSESLFIGDDEEDDADGEQFSFEWMPGPVHEDAIAVVLRSTLAKGEGIGGDDEVIWLAHEAIRDRAVVKAAIEAARRVNALGLGTDVYSGWQEAIAAQPVESA